MIFVIGDTLTTMTLTELINKATELGRRFTTSDIPLKYEGKDVDIDLNISEDKECYMVNVELYI